MKLNIHQIRKIHRRANDFWFLFLTGVFLNMYFHFTYSIRLFLTIGESISGTIWLLSSFEIWRLKKYDKTLNWKDKNDIWDQQNDN